MAHRGPNRPQPNARVNRRFKAAPSHVFPLLESGVDWLTVTCRDGPTSKQFHEFGYSLIHDESLAGADVKPWTFEGFKGLNAGHVALGESEQMSILRLSAGCAWLNWTTAFELSTNCSRIDLQCTVKNVPDPLELILNSHKAALDHVKDYLRPPSVQLRMHNRRGHTLYLGERTSDRFGRVYDKGRESKLDHYTGCIRAEVQFNKRAARECAGALLRKGGKPADVVPYVSHFMSIRGVSPVWPAEAQHCISVPRSRTSAEKRLRWLAAQVRPAVQGLIESGRLSEVLAAIGITAEDILDFGPRGPTKPKEE